VTVLDFPDPCDSPEVRRTGFYDFTNPFALATGEWRARDARNAKKGLPVKWDINMRARAE